MIISITLLLTCILTPIYIAFHEESFGEGINSIHTINLVIDIVFGIDILVVFMSPFYEIKETCMLKLI